MTNSRDLIQRLTDWLEKAPPPDSFLIRGALNKDLAEARAYLATSEPAADPVKELISQCKPLDPELAAVLTPSARWRLYDGESTPEPAAGPTDEQLIRIYQAAYQPAWERGEMYGCHVDGLRAVLARYGHQPPQPIPLSDQIPKSTDCDAKGRCWWWDPYAIPAWVLSHKDTPGLETWLPHHALPLPEAEP